VLKQHIYQQVPTSGRESFSLHGEGDMERPAETSTLLLHLPDLQVEQEGGGSGTTNSVLRCVS